MLKAEHISKCFKVKSEKKQILDDVSITVRDHETVGIVGSSGCGKSTLARIICGTIKMDKGTITYDDEPVISSNGKYNPGMRRNIQLIGQQPFMALDPLQKVGNAIMEPMLRHKMGNAEMCRQRAKELLETVWLDPEVMDSYPHELSGGMCQRVVIARVCALEPKLLIADESTSMLDASAQAQVIRLLYRLKREKGLSILFISHDMDLVNSFSDRVLRMENHKLNY